MFTASIPEAAAVDFIWLGDLWLQTPWQEVVWVTEEAIGLLISSDYA